MIQSQDRFENTLEWALSPGDEYQVTLVGVSHVHSRQPSTVNPVTVTGKVTTLDPNTDGRYVSWRRWCRKRAGADAGGLSLSRVVLPSAARVTLRPTLDVILLGRLG